MDYLFALQSIREAAPDFINYVFLFISEYLMLVSFIIPAIIYWNFDKSAGATIFLGYCISFDFNQTIKNVACVYRPWYLDSRLHIDSHGLKSATGYSFPSGHTTNAASIYGGISIWQKKRKPVVFAMSLMILLTAFSRNWLGAHTLKDVVFSIIFVACWLSLVCLVKSWLEKNPSRDTIVCFGMILVATFLLIFLYFKSYPIDYTLDGKIIADPFEMKIDCFTAYGCVTGSFIGWWLERHFVNFSTQVESRIKWIRSVTGILICLGLYLGLGPIFSFLGTHLAHLIKYFILFFYMTFLHPLMFTRKLARRKK